MRIYHKILHQIFCQSHRFSEISGKSFEKITKSCVHLSIFINIFQAIVNYFMAEVPIIQKPVQWICRVNQRTGYYMIGTSIMTELKKAQLLQANYSCMTHLFESINYYLRTLINRHTSVLENLEQLFREVGSDLKSKKNIPAVVHKGKRNIFGPTEY